MSEWDDAVLYNDYEGMKECYAKLQEENKKLRGKAKFDNQFHKRTMEHYEKALINWTLDIKKLEAIRCVINDPPTYSIPFLGNPAPEVQDYRNRMDAWYCKLLNIAHTAQNTDYVQKEEAT